MFLPTIAAGAHSSYFIDTNYQCWTCGGRKAAPVKESYLNDHEVKLVAGAPENLHLLMEDGKVLKRDLCNGYIEMKKIDDLPEIEMLAAGELFALFLDIDGVTWVTGVIEDTRPTKQPNYHGYYGYQKPQEPVFIGARRLSTQNCIRYISCVKNSAILLSEEGEVFGLGCNFDGQLGLAAPPKLYAQMPTAIPHFVATPTKVEGLPRIVSVSCGYYHSLLLDVDGFVHCSGKNVDGQLGFGDLEKRNQFTKNPNFQDVQQIAAGGAHSLILDNKGVVWSCGYDGDGQLGTERKPLQSMNIPAFTLEPIPKKESSKQKKARMERQNKAKQEYAEKLLQMSKEMAAQQLPRKVDLPEIQFIAAGYLHSLFLDTSGNMWACGFNDRGQLGTGDKNKRYTPCKIEGLPSILTILRNAPNHRIKNARK